MNEAATLPIEDEFDLLVAELRDCMEEYIVCLREIPNVEGAFKIDLWNAAVRKHDYMAELLRRLGEAREKLSYNAPKTPTPAAQILLDACSALSLQVGYHTDARTLAYECGRKADAIRDPVARKSAQQWLSRALTYAETNKRPAAMTCMKNAADQFGK